VVSTPAFGGIPVRQLPNLLGLFAGWPLARDFRTVVQAVVALVTLVVLVQTARLRPSVGSGRSLRLCFACVVVAAVLSGYSTNTYDLSLLVVPLALVADYCIVNIRADRRRRARLIAPAIPLLISPVWFFLWMRWERVHLIALFLLWWLYTMRSEARQNREAAQPA
jgi:hypothetical protein